MPGPIAAAAARLRAVTPQVLGEKIYAATAAGHLSFLPFLDRYTGEDVSMLPVYREMLKAPVVKAAVLGKVYAVASLDLQMNPASDSPRDQEIADFVTFALTSAIDGGIPKLAETILLHGLIDKWSISEKVWDESLWRRGRWTGKRFFRAIKAKDRVQLIQDEFRNVVGVRSTQFGQSRVFQTSDFVIFRNLPLFEGSGISDFRAAYGKHWMLDTVEKVRIIHLEKFTSPQMVGTYQNVEDKDNLERELAAMKARSWMAIPEGVRVEAMALATRGEAEYAQAVRDYKEDIALAISGAFLQMLTSNSGGGASIRGDSKTQKSTAELFVWALAAKLQHIIDKQVTPDLVDMNYTDADYPSAQLGSINDADMKPSADLDAVLQSLGFPLSKKATAKKYARPIASEPDDILVPAAAGAPAQPPGGGGGQGFFQ